MIEERVRTALQIEYESRLMVFDHSDFAASYDYVSLLRSCGFSVYLYDDIERIRFLYETEIRHAKTPCAMIVTGDLYVPTDIRRAFHEVGISIETVFPLMKLCLSARAQVSSRHQAPLSAIYLPLNRNI